MSRAAMSMRVFGVYLAVLGPGLVFVPGLLLGMFGLPESREPWIRVIGALVFNIGLYYWFTAATEDRRLFALSVFSRLLFVASAVAMVATGWFPTQVLGMVALDVVGAAWTLLALRADGGR